MKANIEEENKLVYECIQTRMDKTNSLLSAKGIEYTRNNDRLHNFRDGAKMDNITMSQCCHDYFRKHLSSYKDLLQDIKDGKDVSFTLIEAKIGDMIVYLHLQEAILKIESLNNKILIDENVVKQYCNCSK